MARRMKMKELEARTGVGRETIRFYIRQGLLPEPERPGRNVAWYGEEFVQKVALIKRLQQERFLPLDVIRAIVTADRPPTDEELDTLHQLEGRLTAHVRLRENEEPLSDVARRVSLSVREIRRLAGTGAFEIVTRGGRSWIEGNAIGIVELWSRLRKAGFTEELGVTAEDLGVYVRFADWLAREELRLFTRNVSTIADPDETRRLAETGIDVMARILTLLRESAILRQIAETRTDENSTARAS